MTAATARPETSIARFEEDLPSTAVERVMFTCFMLLCGGLAFATSYGRHHSFWYALGYTLLMIVVIGWYPIKKAWQRRRRVSVYSDAILIADSATRDARFETRDIVKLTLEPRSPFTLGLDVVRIWVPGSKSPREVRTRRGAELLAAIEHARAARRPGP